jgi:hypothetical protein
LQSFVTKNGTDINWLELAKPFYKIAVSSPLMSEIKVQCDCGQKLKFDVDPSYTRIPFPVNCPVCGADCSDKANQLLGTLVPAAGSAAPVAVGAPTAAPRLRIGASGHAPAATAEAPPATAPMPSARPGAFPGRPGAVPAAGDGTPKRKGNFALGFAGAIAGALVGAALFYFVFKLTGFRLGLMGLAVGFLTGLGARLLGGEQEGNELGYIAGALAVAAILGAQYFVARSWWSEIGNSKPTSNYEAKVAEAQKVVAAVPSGTDQEIRIYLAKELSAEEDEKVNPTDIDADMVKDFKGQLPEYQNLASGKISKADYEKQHAEEIAKEKAEQDSDEGTFKAVFVLVLLNRISLVCMCGGAALAFKMCS